MTEIDTKWRETPIKVGVSQCLLGENVRYDGGHKKSEYLTQVLADFFEFVAVCPEVEFGMGIPREIVNLHDDGRGIRMRTKSEKDITDEMRSFSKRRVAALVNEDLCGYILKKDSPSCGLFRVKVYDKNHVPAKRGRGLFAEALADAMPFLPMEEEGRLGDAKLRENFIERVFAFRRLKSFFAGKWKIGDLVAFHAAEKLLLMAHSPKAYAELGPLVAKAKEMGRAELQKSYCEIYMRAMAEIATTGRHTNVLQHMAGYFKDELDTAEKDELSRLIKDYRAGLLPLVVPLTMIRHYVARFQTSYLAGQVYLDPHPKELMLRNHV
jgi:uncharacterized protein YbgA (DUF1722 family)/uncharacterized protein YbbK (DUF523 family)